MIVTWIGIIAGLYAAWLSVLWIMQDSMLFPRSLAGPPAPGPPTGVESIWIETEQGRVEAWFWTAPGTDAAPRPLLVFFHGNGELMDGCLDVAGEWRRRGFNVLLPEYRGYGRSAGTPGESAIVADSLKLVAVALDRPEVDPAGLVFHGRSLGAGVAAQVAIRLRQRPHALILQSAFTSVASFASGLLAPQWLVRSPFRTDEALGEFPGRVLILHGAHDEVVPVSHGRRLHRLIPGSTYAELPGHHNDFPLDEKAYWRAIQSFLAD